MLASDGAAQDSRGTGQVNRPPPGGSDDPVRIAFDYLVRWHTGQPLSYAAIDAGRQALSDLDRREAAELDRLLVAHPDRRVQAIADTPEDVEERRRARRDAAAERARAAAMSEPERESYLRLAKVRRVVKTMAEGQRGRWKWLTDDQWAWFYGLDDKGRAELHVRLGRTRPWSAADAARYRALCMQAEVARREREKKLALVEKRRRARRDWFDEARQRLPAETAETEPPLPYYSDILKSMGAAIDALNAQRASELTALTENRAIGRAEFRRGRREVRAGYGKKTEAIRKAAADTYRAREAALHADPGVAAAAYVEPQMSDKNINGAASAGDPQASYGGSGANKVEEETMEEKANPAGATGSTSASRDGADGGQDEYANDGVVVGGHDCAADRTATAAGDRSGRGRGDGPCNLDGRPSDNPCSGGDGRLDDADSDGAEDRTDAADGDAGTTADSGANPGAASADTGSTNDEPPLPLIREIAPADPFPIEALGDVLAGAAKGIHDRVQAPMAICGQSVLAAATLAVQAHADVQLPTGHARPLSIYYTTVAASGERKSACDNEALWPIHKHETALRAQYDQDLLRYGNDHAAWETQRRQILNDKRKCPDRDRKKRALDELGPPPAAPLVPLLTCPEPTFEGLCKLMMIGQPSVGVFSDEGGQFVGGFAMSDEHKLKTAAAMSGLWDGAPIRRVRSGDGATILPGRRVSLHLMMQPEVSAGLLGDRMLADQGLLSRLLVTAPASAVGTRMSHSLDPVSAAAIKSYGARLLAILETPLPLAEGKSNELCPRVVPLSAKAQRRWRAYADHVEGAMAPGGPLEPIRGLANKLPEHAARLAAVLALIDDLGASELAPCYLEAGIALADHYAAEALRLFNAGRISPDLSLACRLLDWLRGWPEPAISLPDIYQLGPNAIRDAQTAGRIVSILVGHRWLQKVRKPTTVRGVMRRDVWWIMGKSR